MIRPARPEDVDVVLALIQELADYEKALDEAQATAEQLTTALFGPSAAVFCLVAESEGAVVGFALWFRTFSTWLGRHGIYLEDLYVRPTARRAGHGRALLAELAAIAAENGYGRLEWAVLDWNSPAQAFYTSVGAEPMDEWTTWRVSGPALPRLGHSASRVG